MKIGRYFAATPTPLNPDHSFDEPSAKRLCQHWVDLGLDGALLLGTMGEGPFLPDTVRDAFVKLAVEEVGDKLTLFTSCADLSADRMLERARRYADLGAPYAVLCIPPKCSPAAGVAAICEVASQSPIPCGYYEIPSMTGTALGIQEIKAIMAHPNIHVMKDSSNNALLMQLLTTEEFGNESVTLLNGCEYNDISAALAGYDGALHGGGALAGRMVRRIWEATEAGDLEEASAMLSRKCIALAGIYNRVGNPLQHTVGQKYALHLLGVLDHYSVVIDQQLSDGDKERIRKVVEANRDWM